MRKRIIATAFVVVLIVIGLLYLLSPLLAPHLTKYLQVYIRPDGTIEPSSMQINREGNLYTLQANITLENLFIEKSNIILDGNGFKIKITTPSVGKSPGRGKIELTNVENVTLNNVITGYPQLTKNNAYENYPAAHLIFENCSFCESINSDVWSISINNSSGIRVSGYEGGRTSSQNEGAIELTNSRNCNISACTLVGVSLINSHENMFLNNYMTLMKTLALRLEDSTGNLFFGNRIERSHKLFEITGSSANNLFVGNYIQGAFSHEPILNCGGVNTFYHNNFVYVYWNKTVTDDSPNRWDNGSEGNYWNDYQGEDVNGDGVGDTPHFVDDNNKDRYPLMNPLDLSKEPMPKFP